MNSELTPNQVRADVRERYALAVAKTASYCAPSCCSNEPSEGRVVALADYRADELREIPADAVASSFGCGNPIGLAGIRPGETVVDIGSGAGMDALLAARRVGPAGRVIGIDMTPAMLDRARQNASQAGLPNVEFRQGEAEAMPIDDDSADWIVSNCVINLSPEKPRVFAEAFRVLRPGGRFSVADIVAEELPEPVRRSAALHAACLSGAIPEADYVRGLEAAGFVDVKVVDRLVYDRAALVALAGCESEAVLAELGADQDLDALDVLIGGVAGKVASIRIMGRKPGGGGKETGIEGAVQDDLGSVEALLRDADLPVEGVRESFSDFLVAKSETGAVVGAVGLERFGDVALLRSLVVDSSMRSAGIGSRLSGAIEEAAREKGVRKLFLLTTTAEKFFAARGFLRIERAEAPEAIRGTVEFRSCCPSTAIAMTKRIV